MFNLIVRFQSIEKYLDTCRGTDGDMLGGTWGHAGGHMGTCWGAHGDMQRYIPGSKINMVDCVPI